jgi:hypothetical protein
MPDQQQSNVVDINDARQKQAPTEQMVADGTDLAVAMAPQALPVLPTEAHVLDLFVTGLMGAGIGLLLSPSVSGIGLGALGGVSFGLIEKALLGQKAGIAQDQRVIYAVAALGTTIGAGYLSYRLR